MNLNLIRAHTRKALRLLSRTFIPSQKNTPIAMSTLSKFLMDAKKRYLNVVRTGGGRSWTVVMGNEAGGMHGPA